MSRVPTLIVISVTTIASTIVLATVLAFALTVASTIAPGVASAEIPTLVNYQGILTNTAGTPLQGTYTLTFHIYRDSLGTQSVWMERHYNVPVSEGLFNVLLGTTAPITRTVFVAPDRWIGTTVNTDTEMRPLMRVTSQPFAVHAAYADSASVSGGGGGSAGWTIVDPNMYSAVSGNVGIGTTSPQKKLQVGNNTDPNAEGMIRLASHSGTQGSNRVWDIGVPETDGVSSGIGYSFVVDDIGAGTDPEFMVKWGTGYVGVGTTSPNAPLHVVKPEGSAAESAFHLQTNFYNGVLHLHDDLYFDLNAINAEGTFGDLAIKLNDTSTGSVLLANGGGNVGIGTSSPQARLDVAGTARVSVLQIAGADLAERFPVSESIEPGMVVAIDPNRPGQLTLSRSAYDRCVAGVVSGANDLPAGAILGIATDKGNGATVAISGRVWVRCDATESPIRPGDLLTTSAIPGHAMKAADYERARGAMIGKAMTALPSGHGLVLVLIGLQ